MRKFCLSALLLSAFILTSCSQGYSLTKVQALTHVEQTDTGVPNFKFQENYLYGISCAVNLEHECFFDTEVEVGASSRATCTAKVKPSSGAAIDCMPETVKNNLVLAGVIIVVTRPEKNKYQFSITTSSGDTRIQEVQTLEDLNFGGANEALGDL